MFEWPEQQDLKSEILDSAPVAMAVYDTAQNIIWANRAYQERVAAAPDEIVGRKCYAVWGFDSPCPGCPAAAAVETGRRHESCLTPCAQMQWQVRAVPVEDADGKAIGALAAIFEIDSYQDQVRRYERTTAALMRLLNYAPNHSSAELLREFLDEAEALTDSQIGFYHFVEEDQVTLSLQMWSTNTLKNCSAVGAGTKYPIQQAGVWVDCVRQGAAVIHNDYTGLPHKKGLPEGHVPIVRELVVPVVRSGKLLAILGVGNKQSDYDEYDLRVVEQLAGMAWEAITRKRAEEENRQLQNQFIKAQKMESVGRLAGGVAHDYNNMLSIIIGYAEAALENVPPAGQLHDDLQEILAAANHSVEITRQLLAFARRQTVAPKVLEMNMTVDGMLKMLRRLIGEDIELIWLPGDDVWPVKIDPTQMDQILANLCVNARDAIGGVGRITIETGNGRFDDAYCADHVGFVPGEYALLTVSDDGCGMERETLKQIFEPFFTTKDADRGTGLGLATVYGIVKQNNGFVNVYSEPGQGTVFRIYLPRHAGVTVEAFHREKALADLQGSGETIMVVEDDAAILRLNRKILQEYGYTVLTAGTSGEALRLASEHGGGIRLLITDVIMPGMNGRELAEKLQTVNPNLKCLFMSGYTADVIAHHGVLDEGVHFIQKPASRSDLAAKVKAVLGEARR